MEPTKAIRSLLQLLLIVYVNSFTKLLLKRSKEIRISWWDQKKIGVVVKVVDHTKSSPFCHPFGHLNFFFIHLITSNLPSKTLFLVCVCVCFLNAKGISWINLAKYFCCCYFLKIICEISRYWFGNCELF